MIQPIMLDIEVKQDAYKTINSRTSTEILGFLGDIGGFKESLLIMLTIFG